MQTQVLDHINKKLIEREKSLMEFVGDGGCKTFDHYKELCGFIRGLKTAQFEISDLVQKIKVNDDDEL
jgi:hypothetical protein